MAKVLPTSVAKSRDQRLMCVKRQDGRGFSVAGLAATLIAFIAAWEPNDALRYGPFIAAGCLLFSHPLRFRIGRTEWVLVLFLLWAVLSLFWTEHPSMYAPKLIALSSLIIMFVGVRAANRWGKNEAMAVGGYVVGCLYGLAQTSFQLITGTGTVYRDSFGRITQAGELNVNYVSYTSLTAIVLILLALHGRQIHSRRLRVLAIAVLAILVVGAFSTQTRGVQVSVALLGIWLLISKFGRPVKTITAASVIAMVSISFGWVNEWLRQIESGSRSVAGLSGRLTLWDTARDTWWESVFTGAGLGADRAVNEGNLVTHNTILGLGVTLGIVGLALFFTFAISALNDRIQDLSNPIRRFRLITIIIAFTPILLTSSWEWTASGWVGLALLSTPILAAGAQSSETS